MRYPQVLLYRQHPLDGNRGPFSGALQLGRCPALPDFCRSRQPTRRENPVRQDGYRLFEVDSPVRKMDRHHAAIQFPVIDVGFEQAAALCRDGSEIRVAESIPNLISGTTGNSWATGMRRSRNSPKDRAM